MSIANSTIIKKRQSSLRTAIVNRIRKVLIDCLIQSNSTNIKIDLDFPFPKAVVRNEESEFLVFVESIIFDRCDIGICASEIDTNKLMHTKISEYGIDDLISILNSIEMVVNSSQI